MDLLNTLKEKFSSETEELEIYPDRAEKLFNERKEEEIESARERSEELVNRTEDIVQRLEDNLKELKDYKDQDDLNVVEDVAESFYQSRKRLVENLNPSDRITEHQKDLREFLNEFNDVSRKQGAVMNRIEKDSGQLSSSLDELLEHTDEIKDFLENEYGAVKNLEQISDLEKEIQNLKDEVKEKEEELENEETEPIESDIEEKEEEIEELKQGEEYREKEELEEELEQKKKDQKEMQKEMSGQISRLERGLKKLTYNVRNNGISFEGNLEKLQDLREEKFDKVENPRPELNEALEIIKEEEIIDGRQLDKFKDSVNDLSDYDEKMAEIREQSEEIEQLEEKISQFEIEDRIDDLKEEKEELERKLEDKQEEIERKSERIEELHRKIDSKRKALEERLNRYLDAEIEVQGKESGQTEE